MATMYPSFKYADNLPQEILCFFHLRLEGWTIAYVGVWMIFDVAWPHKVLLSNVHHVDAWAPEAGHYI